MKRRHFITACLATTGVPALSGCISGDDTGAEQDSLPTYDVPRYSDWVPAESAVPETGVVFTHINWNAFNALDSDDDSEDDEEIEEVVERIPIFGLPLYGSVVSTLAVLGILFYPFSGDVVPEDGEQPVEGVETESMTWTENLLVFHGGYDPDVFAERYADGFEATERGEEFTVFVGADDNMAYAVSEETLVVGVSPGDGENYRTENLVHAALDRRVDEIGRVVDDEDGQWLFEATGEAPMTFGVWRTDDFAATLDTDDGEATNETEATDETGNGAIDDGTANESGGDRPDADTLDENPIFDPVESLVNNASFTVSDGEMRDLELRFAGIYPEGQEPSEAEVREHLIGTEGVSHEINIDGRRVRATATFDEEPASAADTPN